MKKITALILVISLLCCLAAGCSTESDTAEDTVMTVNGENVSYDDYAAALYQAVSELEDLYESYSGTAVDWDGRFLFDDELTNFDWCLKRASQQIARMCVIRQHAESEGISLTEDDTESIDEEIENYKTQYATSGDDEADLAAFFAAYGYTETSYRAQREISYLYSYLFTALYGEQGSDLSDEELTEYAEENDYITAAHILLRTSRDVTDDDGNSTTEELSDEEKAELLAEAQGFVDELQAIQDDSERWSRFKELMNEYSEDTGLESFPNGYCFTTDTMVDEFDDAARALSEYEVSDVVESDYGYHVIIRLPTTGDDSVSYSNGYTSSVVPLSYIAAPVYYDAQVADWATSAEIKYTDLYESIDYSSFMSSGSFEFVSYADYIASQTND